MAKRRTRTAQADGFDPYSAQRYMKGRKSHHAAATHQNPQDKRATGLGWIIVIVGLFVFAGLMMIINQG
jgi:hypothetical protein